MKNTSSPSGVSRREMLKRSVTSVAAASWGVVVPGAAARDSVAGDDQQVAPWVARRRPACLDLKWAKGTGLIWMAGETLFYDNPRNRYMRFRRRFDVAGQPRRAELRLFADTQYIAWLNGVEIGRGPGRSDHTWTYFDTYEVAAMLRPGANTLAVLGLFHGFGTGGRQSIMQALLAHLEIETADGQFQHVVSDRTWKASPAEDFVRPTPRLHATLGCVEVQDLRCADAGWQQPEYDDAAWPASDYVKPGLENTPWYHFVPEPLPPRQIVAHPFPRTLRLGAVELALPAVAELGAVRPAVADEAATLPLRLPGKSTARVVTFDLGRVECGFLTLEITGAAGATVDVLCGELLVAGRLPKPGSARVHTTRFILREGRNQLEVAFNWIAFRYAQLWIWTPQPLEIHDAILRRVSLPLGPGGQFTCSDPFLKQLDTACEHTLRLCAQDGLLDSSSREQQQWIGDGRFAAVTLHHRFAVGTLHRRLIEQVGQGVDWLGSLVPRFPTGNLNVSPIPLYSLQWVLAFRDYAWFTGDESLVAEWWPLIQHVLRWFTAFERADGLLERVPHWMYIDTGDGRGHAPSTGVINTTLNLLYRDALSFAAQTAAADRPTARYFETRAARLAAAIRAVLWDEATGAYRDSLDAKGRWGTLSEGTNAYALAYLEAPGSRRAQQIIRTVFAAPTREPIQASPFAMNVVLEALGRHGRADLVFPMLPARYTEQVQTGTMWEHWTSHTVDKHGLPNANSLSHAWGAGPLAFFVNAVVGIRPAAPGWRLVRIAPQPGPLSHAEASVATAHGLIHAAWEIKGDSFRLRVKLPEKMGGTCRLVGTEPVILNGAGDFSCKLHQGAPTPTRFTQPKT